MADPTASATLNPTAGLALLVDDNPGVLAAWQKYFTRNGLPAIGVTTVEEAIRQVKNTPGIVLVSTDVDLSGGGDNTPNTEGETLAVEIRKLRAKMPIIAYTAHDEEVFLQRLDVNVFTRFYSKDNNKIEEIFSQCVQLASEYKLDRSTLADLELQRLQQKFDIPDYEITTLRQFIPGTPATLSTPVGQTSVDDLLRSTGFRLEFLEAGIEVEAEDGQIRHTFAPIPLWFRRESGETVVAELHGHPSIYSVGRTESEAMTSIVQLMSGYHDDFQDRPESEFSRELLLLRGYLQKVF